MSSGSLLYEWDQGHAQHMPVLGEHRATSFEKGEVFFFFSDKWSIHFHFCFP